VDSASSYPLIPPHHIHYACCFIAYPLCLLLHRTLSPLPCERVRTLSLTHTLSHHPYTHTHTLPLSLSLHHALSRAHALPLFTLCTHAYTRILFSLSLSLSLAHTDTHTHMCRCSCRLSLTLQTLPCLSHQRHCLVSHTKDTAWSLTLKTLPCLSHCHALWDCRDNRDCSTDMCEHKRRRYYCRECQGAGSCEHNNRRWRCRECNGCYTCQHGLIKTNCIECEVSKTGGRSLCACTPMLFSNGASCVLCAVRL